MNKVKYFVTVLCLLLVFCFLVVQAYYWLHPFDTRPFDKVVWAQANQDERASMAYDAIRHLPPGMLEDEIEMSLGKPMAVTPVNRLSGFAPKGTVRTYTYFIGNWPMAAFDSTYLWVHMDAEGRIVSTVIGGY